MLPFLLFYLCQIIVKTDAYNIDACTTKAEEWPKDLVLLNYEPTGSQLTKINVADINECALKFCQQKSAAAAFYYLRNICTILKKDDLNEISMSKQNGAKILFASSSAYDKFSEQVKASKYRSMPGITTVELQDQVLSQTFNISILPNAVVMLDASLVTIKGDPLFDVLFNITEDGKPSKYDWARTSNSLAVGTITNKKVDQSVITITGLVPGLYQYALVVSDLFMAQLYDITINVVWDPAVYKMMKVHIQKDITEYNFKDEERVLATMGEKLLKKYDSTVDLVVDEVQEDLFNGNSIVICHITFLNEYLMPTKTPEVKELVGVVQDIVYKNPNFTGIPITKVTSMMCLHDCGPHGTCHRRTHECICDAGYTENKWEALHTGDPNCNIKKSTALIVCISVLTLIILLLGGTCYLIRRTIRRRKQLSCQADMDIGYADLLRNSIHRNSELSTTTN